MSAHRRLRSPPCSADSWPWLQAEGVGGIASYLQGYRDLALFGSLNNRLNFFVYAQPSIVDAAGLRGKRFGVSRFGGVGDFAARYFLKRARLDPRKDVSFLQVGSQSEMTPALTRGAIEAGVVSVPQNFTVKKLGFKELADLTQSGARYASNAFLAKRQFLIDNQARMESFLKALNRIDSLYQNQAARSVKHTILLHSDDGSRSVGTLPMTSTCKRSGRRFPIFSRKT